MNHHYQFIFAQLIETYDSSVAVIIERYWYRIKIIKGPMKSNFTYVIFAILLSINMFSSLQIQHELVKEIFFFFFYFSTLKTDSCGFLTYSVNQC